jgi:hypothetical protein
MDNRERHLKRVRDMVASSVARGETAQEATAEAQKTFQNLSDSLVQWRDLTKERSRELADLHLLNVASMKAVVAAFRAAKSPAAVSLDTYEEIEICRISFQLAYVLGRIDERRAQGIALANGAGEEPRS